jgi:hypothetical protein
LPLPAAAGAGAEAVWLPLGFCIPCSVKEGLGREKSRGRRFGLPPLPEGARHGAPARFRASPSALVWYKVLKLVVIFGY